MELLHNRPRAKGHWELHAVTIIAPFTPDKNKKKKWSTRWVRGWKLTRRWFSDNQTNYLALHTWRHSANEGLFPKRWPEEGPQRKFKTKWAADFIPFPLHPPKCCTYPTRFQRICLSKTLCCYCYVVALYAVGILGLEGEAKGILYCDSVWLTAPFMYFYISSTKGKIEWRWKHNRYFSSNMLLYLKFPLRCGATY